MEEEKEDREEEEEEDTVRVRKNVFIHYEVPLHF